MNDDALLAEFRRIFHTEPELLAIAPGRVNLIGEHTDYNDGFVFPAAIDRGLRVVAARCEGGSRLVSMQMGEAAGFEASTIEPGLLQDWSRYPAGMAWVLRDRGQIPNVLAIVDSDIPIGSGVSSSAALEMAFGVLYNETVELGIGNKDLAILAQRDENEFVGMKSGIMDQMASAMGKAGHAMYLDTRTLEIVYAQIPAHLTIVICDTKTPRALTASAYNERRSQCEEAARLLGVKALRDASLELLEEHRVPMDPVVYRRARHVITEDLRCREFVDALEENQTEKMGSLMRASHESLRDDYEVSSRELDIMAEICWETAGCVGARMTGAGFGGACVALVENVQLSAFADSVNLAYKYTSGISGEVMSCRPVDGARVLWRGHR